jgi:hypothetical protein
VTLPRKIVQTLGRVHSDLGWAIVRLVEKSSRADPPHAAANDVRLIEVADGQFLIVLNSTVFHSLPGVQMIPFSNNQAFLALDPGQGINDLELAVLDRLEQLKTPSPERSAIASLGQQLRRWRRDPRLQSHVRSIVIVTRGRARRKSADPSVGGWPGRHAASLSE